MVTMGQTEITPILQVFKTKRLSENLHASYSYNPTNKHTDCSTALCGEAEGYTVRRRELTTHNLSTNSHTPVAFIHFIVRLLKTNYDCDRTEADN